MNSISIESLLLDYVNQHEGHIRRLIYSMFRCSCTATLVLEYDRETNTVSSHIMQGDNCWYWPSERYIYYYVIKITDLYKSDLSMAFNIMPAVRSFIHSFLTAPSPWI